MASQAPTKETTAVAVHQAEQNALAKRNISDAQWRTLCHSLFPGANPNSVLMVWDYCVARKLDPLKKPCHIVPMEVKDARTGKYEWRDVVMPGIYEHRTTAQRTGQYLGHAKAEYGPEIEYMGVKAPEWCDFTVYRWNPDAQMRAEFPVRTLFREVCATTLDRKSGEMKANARWTKAPFQMLTKCSEASALREAFPDELGGQQTAEEMDGQRHIDAPAIDVKPVLVKPDGYDDWMTDMQLTADEGWDQLSAAWSASKPEFRDYAAKAEPDAFEGLKQRAQQKAAGDAA